MGVKCFPFDSKSEAKQVFRQIDATTRNGSTMKQCTDSTDGCTYIIQFVSVLFVSVPALFYVFYEICFFPPFFSNCPPSQPNPIQTSRVRHNRIGPQRQHRINQPTTQSGEIIELSPLSAYIYTFVPSPIRCFLLPLPLVQSIRLLECRLH